MPGLNNSAIPFNEEGVYFYLNKNGGYWEQ